MENKALILKLYEIGVIKFGEFQLKSGVITPIYFDLRIIISYPSIVKEVSQEMWKCVKKLELDSCDHICGVPYTALPIASVISVDNNMPMLIRRKEAKDYGTKKMVEGIFKQGQTCLIIEDVVVTGDSIYDTAELLQQQGLKVTDAVVFLDRDQGGVHNLKKRGIKLSYAFRLPEVVSMLEEEGKISSSTVAEVKKFLRANSTDPEVISNGH